MGPAIGFAPTEGDLASGWWARRPLRTRLTAAATALTACVITGSAVLLVWRVQVSLSADLDTTTVRQVFAVASETAKAKRPAVPAGITGDAVVQIIDSAGNVVASSSNIDGEKRLFNFPATSASAAPEVRTISGLPIGDNGTFRATAILISTPGETFLVYVALPTHAATRTMTILIGALIAGLPLLVVLVVFATWLFVGRALHPVESMRRQADEITSRDLQQRLRVPPTRDELARLALTLNNMLARTQGAVDRQRQFVADAAHELRSPLASLLAQLEVASTSVPPDRDATDPPNAPNLVLEDARRLSKLVEDLLALAGMDATKHIDTRLNDFDDIVRTEVNSLRPRTRIVIDATQVSAVKVSGNESMLGRAVRNLLDNAIRHADERVSVTLVEVGDQILLVVADDGPGIRPADRIRIFDRFTRLDDGRSRDAGGAGLGLAIVQDIVVVHNGSIQIEDNEPGARFTVRMPRLPDNQR